MKGIFVDTGFWIALLNQNDDLHSPALALAKQYHDVQWFTTEMVLVELLNYLGGKGKNVRQAAAALVRELKAGSSVIVVRQTSAQFDRAHRLYSQRLDKAWSLTDCTSFLVMEKARLTEALAYDLHFEQAGFTALLREK